MGETSGRLNEATPKFTDRVTTSSLPSGSPVGKCAELLGNRDDVLDTRLTHLTSHTVSLTRMEIPA